MNLQSTALLALLIGCVLAGCGAKTPDARPHYALVAVGPSESSVRMFRSAHHLFYTTLDDDRRIASSIATLEAAYNACVELTGIQPSGDDVVQQAFVFARRDEWEAFTRSRAGPDAPIYLRLDRGGYTLGKWCAVRDLGEHDTLTVLAHEQLHLFIANQFKARPPPFLEEGLATLIERVREDDGRALIDLGDSAARAHRIAALVDSRQLMPLRQMLSLHAGNVVGLGDVEVDAFYAQAWAFARFLREGERGKYRPALMRMIKDAATCALSSDSLADDPALVERYLGKSLEAVQVEYERFAKRLSSQMFPAAR